MQVLITGGGGFLGFELSTQLVQNGYRVRSLARGDYPQLARLGVETVRGDIRCYETVHRVLQNIDLVFHVAGKAGVWGKREDYFSTNVIGTQNIVRACLAHKIKYLIYTSSPSVTFSGKSQHGVCEDTPYAKRFYCHYQESKTIAERYVLQNRSPALYTLALRPHLIWGKDDPHLIPRLRERATRFRFIGDGKNLIDTTHIVNAARAHVCAGKALVANHALNGRSYYITNGEPIPIASFVNAVLHAYRQKPVTKKVTRRVGLLAGTICEYAYRLARNKTEPPLTRFTARQLSASHWYNIERARKDLSYLPTITLKEGFKMLMN